MHPEPFRVSLADPHPIVLDGLAEAFARSRRFRVVSRSTSAADALARIRATGPDLLILDLGIETDGTVSLLEEIRRGEGRPRVLVFSETVTGHAISRACALGIDAFISKRMGGDEIVAEASRVVAFRTALLPSVIGFDSRAGESLDVLSGRERDIMMRAARGLSNKEIAQELGITAGTVKVHLHTIYRKLGINRRAELARFSRAATAPLLHARSA